MFTNKHPLFSYDMIEKGDSYMRQNPNKPSLDISDDSDKSMYNHVPY